MFMLSEECFLTESPLIDLTTVIQLFNYVILFFIIRTAAVLCSYICLFT